MQELRSQGKREKYFAKSQLFQFFLEIFEFINYFVNLSCQKCPQLFYQYFREIICRFFRVNMATTQFKKLIKTDGPASELEKQVANHFSELAGSEDLKNQLSELYFVGADVSLLFLDFFCF